MTFLAFAIPFVLLELYALRIATGRHRQAVREALVRMHGEGLR